MNKRTLKSVYQKRCKNAFTLAEVLICLTIIGIVASLTIPVVRNYGSEKQYYAGYKKALTIGTDALEYAIASGKYTPVSKKDDDSNTASVTNNFKEFSNYFSKTKECFDGNNTGCWNANGEKLSSTQPTSAELAFVDSSGFAWALYSNKQNIILVDINNSKSPNQYGKDRWYFVPVSSNGVREGADSTGARAVTLAPYYPLNDSVTNLADITEANENWCQHPPCNLKSGLGQN